MVRVGLSPLFSPLCALHLFVLLLISVPNPSHCKKKHEKHVKGHTIIVSSHAAPHGGGGHGGFDDAASLDKRATTAPMLAVGSGGLSMPSLAMPVMAVPVKVPIHHHHHHHWHHHHIRHVPVPLSTRRMFQTPLHFYNPVVQSRLGRHWQPQLDSVHWRWPITPQRYHQPFNQLRLASYQKAVFQPRYPAFSKALIKPIPSLQPLLRKPIISKRNDQVPAKPKIKKKFKLVKVKKYVKPADAEFLRRFHEEQTKSKQTKKEKKEN